jgi:hypothetical protein
MPKAGVALAAAVVLVFAAVVLRTAAHDTTSVELHTSSADALHEPRDNFSITLQLRDGSLYSATAICEGPISGTGYLASGLAAFNACTAHTNSLHTTDYLESTRRTGQTARKSCRDLIRDAKTFHGPVPPLGKATIIGVFYGDAITRHVDATRGACDRALWKLLAPMFAPTDEAGQIVRPWPPTSEG